MLLLNGCFGVVLNLGEYFLLLLMVTAEDVLVQDGAVVLFQFLFGLVDVFTVLGEILRGPEIKLLIFEQLLAVVRHTHEFGGIRVALVIVDDLVKFLLQLETGGVHGFHALDVGCNRLLATEVLVNIYVAISQVLLLERQKTIELPPVNLLLIQPLKIGLTFGFIVVLFEFEEGVFHSVPGEKIKLIVFILQLVLGRQPL